MSLQEDALRAAAKAEREDAARQDALEIVTLLAARGATRRVLDEGPDWDPRVEHVDARTVDLFDDGLHLRARQHYEGGFARWSTHLVRPLSRRAVALSAFESAFDFVGSGRWRPVRRESETQFRGLAGLGRLLR